MQVRVYRVPKAVELIAVNSGVTGRKIKAQPIRLGIECERKMPPMPGTMIDAVRRPSAAFPTAGHRRSRTYTDSRSYIRNRNRNPLVPGRICR